jgi:hypothetical protein
MVEDWRGHYGITPAQEPRLQEILADYDRSAREVMTKHLGESGRLNALPDAESRALRAAYLDCQLRAERRLLDLLSPEQLAEVRERMPSVWRFEPSGSTSIRIDDSPGF